MTRAELAKLLVEYRVQITQLADRVRDLETVVAFNNIHDRAVSTQHDKSRAVDAALRIRRRDLGEHG